jgi:ATP-dependent Clp protease protease subunit
LGGVKGQASDIEIEAQEILRIKNLLCKIIADHSDKDKDQVMKDFDRNKWMSADEALDYGLVDQIMDRGSK